MSFSENLCKLMQERGCNTYKFAKELCVHVSTVTNWKNGSTPKLPQLFKIAKHFDVPIEYFAEKEDSA